MNRRQARSVVRRPAAGFTLVELLVVICIIGILAALTLVGVISAINASRQSNTEALVQQIHGALDSYRTKWGDYPPSTLGEFKAKLPNDTNNGAEALCACLSSNDGKFYNPSSDESYGNVDKDSAEKNITNWFFGDNQLREILDLWRQPITYMHHKDYAKAGMTVTRYQLRPAGDEQVLKPARSDTTKTYAFPDRYQLRSAGRDGILGNGDDVCGW